MKIGVQLYTLRDEMAKDAKGTLAKLAGMGYRNVETAGLAGLSAAEFRNVLDGLGMRAVASHHGLGAVEGEIGPTVEEAKVLGIEWIVVPWVEEELFRRQPEFGQRLGRAADRLAEHGLKLAYHNHAFEFEPVGVRPAFELLWEHAPRSVRAELDLFWCQHAGHDPVCWLDTLEGRVPLSHFKDGKDGKFSPVGEGALDWEAIVPVARKSGVEYAIVELDESPRDVFDCVRASREFLVKMGLED